MSKIKICGLSRVCDIAVVNRVKPDFVGFVFAPSRRRVDVKTAAALKQILDPGIEAAGVFVNEDIAVVSEIYRNGIIDLAQLHGDEDDEYIRRLKADCGCKVIKAVGVGDVFPVSELPVGADYLLFDALSARRGGTGRAFDWTVLKCYGLPYFLAGGLSSGNAADAIGLLRPFCVDVSSGVETGGVKDANKIIEFVNTVRGIIHE